MCSNLIKTRRVANVYNTNGSFDCEHYAQRGTCVMAITFRNQGDAAVTIDNFCILSKGASYTPLIISGTYDVTSYRYTFETGSSPANSNLLIEVAFMEQ